MGRWKDRNRGLPFGASSYFERGTDRKLFQKHGWKYVTLVITALAVLFAPFFIFMEVVDSPDVSQLSLLIRILQLPLALLGMIGCLAIGVGFCNLLAIFINQYLGDALTKYALIFGGLLAVICGVALHFLGR